MVIGRPNIKFDWWIYASIAFTFMLLNVTWVHAQGSVEIRSPVFSGDEISEISVDFDWTQFAGFYYNIDEGLGSESMHIDKGYVLDPRNIGEGGLVYTTKIQNVGYAFAEWTSDDSYPIMGFLGEEYVPVNNQPDVLSKLIMDSADEYTIRVGEAIELGEGYKLTLRGIDVDGIKAWVELSQNGIYLDDQVITVDPSDADASTWDYREDNVGGENKVVIMRVHVKGIHKDGINDFVTIEGMWLISNEPMKVESDDTFDLLEVTIIGDDSLTLKNKDTIILWKGENIQLAGDLKLKIADSNDVRFYFYKESTEPSTYAVRSSIATGSASWDYSSFTGFYYNLDDNIASETMDVTVTDTRTIAEDDLVYTTTIQQAGYTYVDWAGTFPKMGFLADEYVPVNDRPDVLSKLLVDSNEKYTLRVGQSLDLGEEYTLTPKQIEVGEDKVRLELTKNGVYVDDQIVIVDPSDAEASTWNYEEDGVGGENNVVIMRVHVASVFQSQADSFAVIEGLWLISDDPMEIATDQVFGNLEVTDIGIDSLTLKNYADIILTKGETLQLAEGWKFRVADSDSLRYYLFEATTLPGDQIPPASVTNLGETDVGPSWLNWAWINPTDADFSHVMIYIDGTFIANTSGNSINFYNATGLAEGTVHTIGTQTVDTSGNINPARVSDQATTKIIDRIPPASVTNLGETDIGTNWINWTWTNPIDSDFSHVMVYLNGTFIANTSGNSINFYNATGLVEGITYSIGIHTVDTSGNINPATVDDPATTKVTDRTLPASVINLGETYVGPSWINWTWTNPIDSDFSHVMVYFNGTFIANTSGNSINFYNATGLVEGITYTIGLHTVDTTGNINSTWVNDLATTVKLPKIFGLSGVNITTSSIILVWEASSDTSRVEIHRNDMILGNVSGATTYADSNLSSGTTYSYTLIPYTANGLAGKAVSISLKTASPSSGGGGGGGSSTSKTSSGGGGGGAVSTEDFANVALKDADSEYLRMNANVTYEFTKEDNPIQAVSFYSIKNSGQITATIEVLNNRSKLVKTSPEGLVYKYVNIWVGKSGFATAANIKDAQVRFKVTSSWLQEMDVSPADVKLQRYNGSGWEVLPTTMGSNASGYVIFESQTPGFSPFAITAEKAVVTSVADETAKEPIIPGDVGGEATPPERSGIWTFILAILIIGALAVGYVYLKKRQN